MNSTKVLHDDPSSLLINKAEVLLRAGALTGWKCVGVTYVGSSSQPGRS